MADGKGRLVPSQRSPRRPGRRRPGTKRRVLGWIGIVFGLLIAIPLAGWSYAIDAERQELRKGPTYEARVLDAGGRRLTYEIIEGRHAGRRWTERVMMIFAGDPVGSTQQVYFDERTGRIWTEASLGRPGIFQTLPMWIGLILGSFAALPGAVLLFFGLRARRTSL